MTGSASGVRKRQSGCRQCKVKRVGAQVFDPPPQPLHDGNTDLCSSNVTKGRQLARIVCGVDCNVPATARLFAGLPNMSVSVPRCCQRKEAGTTNRHHKRDPRNLATSRKTKAWRSCHSLLVLSICRAARAFTSRLPMNQASGCCQMRILPARPGKNRVCSLSTP